MTKYEWQTPGVTMTLTDPSEIAEAKRQTAIERKAQKRYLRSCREPLYQDTIARS